MDSLDFFSINDLLNDLNNAWLRDAPGLTRRFQALSEAMMAAGREAGGQFQETAAKNPSDGGKTLLQWIETWTSTSRHYHEVFSNWIDEYIENAPDLDDTARRKARFWAHQILSMLSPSNFFWTNPKAVNRFVDSGGRSLSQGLRNWLDDLKRGDGLVSLSDSASFEIGKNLAVTPGAVVYRNRLMELIQYTPQTENGTQIPVVLIQPWINKYYIFDLSPQNSFVQYLVSQGFRVFITSWKNPTPDMRGIGFDDYLRLGAMQAIRVASEICGTPAVHAAGYCIGGTLLMSLLSWLAHDPAPGPVVDATFFATLVDFSDPGDLGSLVSPASLEAIEQICAAEGRLPSHRLAAAFRLLNSKDLIWRHAVNTYFLGEKPPRSDMLYWNSDSTHLPAAMCLFYLRHIYLENRMIEPRALILDDRPIDLKRIRVPLYIVGASTDHICPWRSTFSSAHRVSGPVRYVLAGDGHITGIVNPPSPWSKKKYWAAAATRRSNADKWLQGCTAQTGSWWPDWVCWLRKRTPATVRLSPPGSSKYPVLGPAPGTYVLECGK